MDQLRSYEVQYRIEHRHHDGSWAEMVDEGPVHDPAGTDVERSWGLRGLFRCKTCDESVIVEPGPSGDLALQG